MKNLKIRAKLFITMLKPFSPWWLLSGGLCLYGIVMQSWITAGLNGAILLALLGSNYNNNRKLLMGK